MAFLPSSPTRLFNTRKTKSATTLKKEDRRASKAMLTTNVDRVSQTSNHPSSQAETIVETNSEKCPSSQGEDSRKTPTTETVGSFVMPPLLGRLVQRRREECGTTNSSPTDHAYIPSIPAESTPASKLIEEPRSFFDDDTESEAESLVVGRASSVRVSKPRIVQHKPIMAGHHPESAQNLHNVNNFDRSTRKSSRLVSSDTTYLSCTGEEDDRANTDNGPAQAYLNLTGHALEEDDQTTEGSSHLMAEESRDRLPSLRISSSRSYIFHRDDQLDTSDPHRNSSAPVTLIDGLRSNPPSDCGRISRTMSAPPLPVKSLKRRVTIRPSDLITNHSQDDHHGFRETVVTTPYPEKSPTYPNSMNSSRKDRAKTATVIVDDENSARASDTTMEKDRFPSPSRSEVLFLDLNLARHPGANTTLEIEVTNKGSFDDEMLFYQIRTAYFKQLLGYGRLPLTLVRTVSYATIATPSQLTHGDEFNGASFARHFYDPRLGRKRKAWTIWLRRMNPSHASQQLSSARQLDTHHPNSGIRKLHGSKSLSLRTIHDIGLLSSKNHSRHPSSISINGGPKSQPQHTERDETTTNATEKTSEKDKKRMSVASDTGSFNFIYNPRNIPIPRLPFLPFLNTTTPTVKPYSASPSSASTYRSFFHPGSISSVESTRTVTVTLHHDFSFCAVVSLALLTVFCGLAASVVWIIFGVPGSRPGSRDVGSSGLGPVMALGIDGMPVPQMVGSTSWNTTGMAGRHEWREDANARVLTGLVLGLVVLLLGLICDAGIVWGGWLLM